MKSIRTRSYLSTYYPESNFGGFTDVDGTLIFYSRINSLLDPTSIVLDIGCGRGAYGGDPVRIRRDLRILKGKVAKVIGVDVDEVARDNPFLDEFRLLTDRHWPVENETVDLAIADFVLEHVENPEAFFAECARVLRPGGHLCLRTANLFSYVGAVAHLVPNRLHAAVLRTAGASREERDIFPTLYRCNTIRKVRRTLERHGFDAVVYGYDSEPGYLNFSRFAYWLGVLHQKIAPQSIRPTIFAFAKRRSQGPLESEGS